MAIKVLIMADDFSEGGAAGVCYDLISNLDRQRFRPVAAGLDGIGFLGGRLKQQNIPFYFLERRPGLDYSLFFKIRKIIKQEKIDIVHLNQYTSFFYGSVGSLLAGNRNIIFTEHGREVPDYVRLKRVIFNKLIIPFIKKVIAVSESVEKSLVEFEKISPGRIQVVLNGLDESPFNQSFDTKVVRDRWGVREGVPVAAIVARLCDYKNHTNVLKAWKTVVKELPKATLLIIGDGPMESELKQLAGCLGISRRVIFTGVVREVPEILSMVDLAVLCSFYEGTSITLLEAMASGKAVVASRVAGNLEVVRDRETGLLVCPENPGEIAETLLRLLKDRSLSQKMGQAGKKRQREVYSLEKMVKSYQDLYLSQFLT